MQTSNWRGVVNFFFKCLNSKLRHKLSSCSTSFKGQIYCLLLSIDLRAGREKIMNYAVCLFSKWISAILIQMGVLHFARSVAFVLLVFMFLTLPDPLYCCW